MKTIDMGMTDRKTAHWADHLVEGNWILEPDPAQPGRYVCSVARQGGGQEFRGYLETKLFANQRVSIARIQKGLDEMDLPMVRC